MKISRNTGWLACAVLCMNAVWMTGCSGSSSDNASEDDDTRLSIQGFLDDEIGTSESPFVEGDSERIRTALNRASFSFANYARQEMELGPSGVGYQDVAVVTWPMLANFPLLLLPAQGTTAEELEADFAQFGSTEDLLSFSSLVRGVYGDDWNDPMQHHVWWQTGSRYEPDFLKLFDELTVPVHHTLDYRETDVGVLLGEHYDGSFLSSLQHVENTRLISLQKMEQVASFAGDGFEAEPFAGDFLRGDRYITLGVPMLRIRGTVDHFENDKLVARRISLDSSGVNLISIQPKPGLFRAVLENLETTDAEMNADWATEQGSVVLPVMSLDSRLYSSDAAEWGSAAYSEIHADLRGMDHQGGLYLQAETYASQFAISGEGIALNAVSANAVTFSELNETYIPRFSGIYIPALHWLNRCEDLVVPDLSESIFIVEDRASGLIQSVATFTEANDDAFDSCDIHGFQIGRDFGGGGGVTVSIGGRSL